MPKGLKFERGFTWQHHFDEWWDRRPHDWKVKFFINLVLVFILAAAGLIFFVFRWIEKEQILSEAKEFHQSRIQASDKMIAPQSKPLPVPGLRNAQEVKVRPAE